MATMLIVTGSPSGSVTPMMPISTNLWLGGHRQAKLGYASETSGGRLGVKTASSLSLASLPQAVVVAVKVIVTGSVAPSGAVTVTTLSELISTVQPLPGSEADQVTKAGSIPDR